jgi:hypothetical protein
MILSLIDRCVLKACYPTMDSLKRFIRRIDVKGINTIIADLNQFLINIADGISNLIVCIYNAVRNHIFLFSVLLQLKLLLETNSS